MAASDSGRFDKEISFHRISASRAVRSFADKRVRGWLEELAGKGLGTPTDDPHYRIDFQKEGKGHFISVEVKVETPKEAWKGQWSAPGLHQALVQCLKHMTRVQYPLRSA